MKRFLAAAALLVCAPILLGADRVPPIPVGRAPFSAEYFSSLPTLAQGSTSSQNLLSIENPSGSTVTVYVMRMLVRGVPTATASTPFLYHAGRTTATPTGGTTLTAQKRKTADAAPQAIVRSAPTATASTGDVWTGSPGVLLSTGGLLPTDVPSGPNSDDDDLTIALAPGEGLLLRADANATTWWHWARVQWREGP